MKLTAWAAWTMVAFAPATGTAWAEEGVDEVTVFGQDRSQISGSALMDTVSARTSSKLDTTELQAGLETKESDINREASKADKPKIEEAKRDKPDVTPQISYQMEWKLILLIGLLESSKK
ncbi:MAG: hypothetical protein A3G34_07630 [Candidatus Lindowbacteria bacterium RIFCSPLOWO2_12_FULL_62_27]|nr:MAG: hypothetical protein A3G34_07630 [Candidatus Lindowbacteria bacterium RIFCSPLOWO2_12_FULL_62_27]OGH62263.1 MAG: hypothetical protein A3I06_08880 [Candidatus Lindowbacteria bacterium RIFCSPLOWO2_02_FULL_62_12]